MSREEQSEIQQRQTQGPTSKEQTFQTQCLDHPSPLYFSTKYMLKSTLFEHKEACIPWNKWWNSDFWFFINYWCKEISGKAADLHLPFLQKSRGPQHESSPGKPVLPILAWLLGLSREPWKFSVSWSWCWRFSTAQMWKGNKAAEGKPQGDAQWEQSLILCVTERHCYTQKTAAAVTWVLFLSRQVQMSLIQCT